MHAQQHLGITATYYYCAGDISNAITRMSISYDRHLAQIFLFPEADATLVDLLLQLLLVHRL